MKSLLALIVIVVLTLLLRSTALTALAARGVVLDVLAFATVLWALRHGENWGSSFGFALGLAADLDAAHWLGRHALVLALIGYGIGRMSRSLVRDSARTQAVLLLIATFVHQLWVVVFEIGGVAGWLYLVRRVVLATLVTVPIGTLMVAMIRRVSGQALFGHASVQANPAE